MIINCNSCDKKFVIPDQAITSSGRMVQCGSCGNKWKQYPKVGEKILPLKKEKILPLKKSKSIPKVSVTKISKPKKKTTKRKREIDLYSPEYLAKKHGINLNTKDDKPITKNKVSLGFYGSLIIFIIFLIVFSRSIYFFQDFIIQKFPSTKYYLEYFFESIRNLFEIWKSLILIY